MTPTFTTHKKIYYLNWTISFESYAILMWVGNPKTTINNKASETEQKFVLDPVKQVKLDILFVLK